MVRILLVSDSASTFVLRDQEILRELGETRILLYRGRRDLLRLAVSVLRADVVICWFALGYATTSTALGRVFRKSAVVVAGGWDVVALPDIGYGAMLTEDRVLKTRQALRMATAVVAVSEATRREVLRWVNREVTVIPNGVDVDFFRPADAPRLRQVVTVAGVNSESRFRVKGLRFLMDIAERMTDVSFVLAGGNTPEWQERLKVIAPSNVRIVGFLDPTALKELYQTSRVYLQPSVYESFGLSLAEAMSCGCYPVVTNGGALPEVVDGVGSTIQFGDLDAAVQAVHRGLETERCEAASAKVRQLYSLDLRRKHLLQLVQRILDGAAV